MKLNQNLEILYEDSHIIVCKKPAGIATQSNSLRTPDMEQLIQRHLYKTQKKEPYLAIIHRLDQPVSGILVFGKTPAAAKELNRQLQTKGFGKHYKALLTVEPPSALTNVPLVHYMKKNATTNMSSICNSDDPLGKKAVLTFQSCGSPQTYEKQLFKHCGITNFENLYSVNIQLDTGRYHQIRLQMAHLGCPIWGDTKYGEHPMTLNPENKWVNIALCAYKLEFLHPITKKCLTFHL